MTEEYFLFAPFVIRSIYFKWGWNFAYFFGDWRTPQVTSKTNDIWISEAIYPPCRIREKKPPRCSFRWRNCNSRYFVNENWFCVYWSIFIKRLTREINITNIDFNHEMFLFLNRTNKLSRGKNCSGNVIVWRFLSSYVIGEQGFIGGFMNA